MLSLHFPADRNEGVVYKQTGASSLFTSQFIQLYIRKGVENQSKPYCSTIYSHYVQSHMCGHNGGALLLVWSSVVSFAFHTHDLLEFMNATPSKEVQIWTIGVIHCWQVNS